MKGLNGQVPSADMMAMVNEHATYKGTGHCCRGYIRGRIG